jgi:phosphodiesterase/alkaline phosphatase D-like protein
MRIRYALLVAVLATMIMGAHDVQAQTTWNSVTLAWTTPGDDSLTGTASQFDIRYSTSAITASNFASATRVTGAPAPAAPGTRQTFVVNGLAPSTTYWFALKTADDIPNWSILSNVVTRATSAVPDTLRPAPLAIAASSATDSTITLAWTAVGDDSLTGTATSYDIRYSTSPITAANFAAATAVAGAPAPAVAGTAQTVMVRGLGRQTSYWFAAKAVDEAAHSSGISNVPSASTTDTLSPAAVRDLAASFVWIGWSTSADVTRRVRVRG